jgi:hypothetical protein
VFVVQPPSRIDSKTREVVQKYDLTPAAKFGRLVSVLGPGNIYGSRLAQAQDQIREVLRTYDESDYILAIGDPVAIFQLDGEHRVRKRFDDRSLHFNRVSLGHRLIPLPLAW